MDLKDKLTRSGGLDFTRPDELKKESSMKLFIFLCGLIGMYSVAQERYVSDRFYEALPYWEESVDVRDLILALVPAPVPKTGQTTSYAVGDDGDLQRGAAWPNPRFTDNSDGTVTDTLTGLIWLKNANCGGSMNWTNALTYCNSLANGQCGLTDGSSAGDWRLPNVQELQSLIDYQFYNPALSNAAGTGQWTEGNAFSGVQSDFYWSSTTLANDTSYAWLVNLYNGNVLYGTKSSTIYVWPVRGGQ